MPKLPVFSKYIFQEYQPFWWKVFVLAKKLKS
jgi:hypothetical protein